ncbi:hypothetical protein T484DRAFT_1911274, partial [Baffinella frigidus]
MGGDKFKPGGGGMETGKGGGKGNRKGAGFRGPRTERNAGWTPEEADDAALPEEELMREHMVPIEYRPQTMDGYAWEQIDLDSVKMGKGFDFHGLISVEKITGDKAEKMMRKLGHPSTKTPEGKKKKGGKDEGGGEV